MEVIQGLEKSVKKFNRWKGISRIFYNLELNEVWTKVFIHAADYIPYSDSSIIEIYSKTTLAEQTKMITQRELSILCLQASLKNKRDVVTVANGQ